MAGRTASQTVPDSGAVRIAPLPEGEYEIGIDREGILGKVAVSGTAFGQYPGWKHTGSLFLNTTPDGANLPAGDCGRGCGYGVSADRVLTRGLMSAFDPLRTLAP